MQNAGLEESQAGIKIARRSISNLRYADNTTLMAENEEQLKSLLVKVERGQWKSFKYNIKKIKIMAFSTITSWQIEGEKWKEWGILFSWASKLPHRVIAAMKLKDACFLEGKLWQM